MTKTTFVSEAAETQSDSEINQQHLPTELRGVFLVFPGVAAATLLILALADPIRGPTGTHLLGIQNEAIAAHAKSIDHLIYAVAVIAAAAIAAIYARFLPVKRIWALVPVFGSLAGLCFGISAIESATATSSRYFWAGFGLATLALSIALVPLFWRLVNWSDLPRWVRIPVSLGVAFICVGDLAAMVRTFNYEGLGGFQQNNMFVLNEVLGPPAGFFPGWNSLPEYVHLYGFILKPFAHVASVRTLTSAAIIMMTVCSIAAAILGVLIAHRALGRRSITMAAALVIPITSVTTLHNPLTNVAGAAFQGIPIRVFPGVLIGAIGLDQVVRIRSGHYRRLVLVLFGVLCGLVAWNNQDFDLESVAAFGIVFYVATWRIAARWRARAAILTGLFVGLAIYPVWATASGHPLLWHDLLYFQTEYSAGYTHFPISIIGPVLVVMPVLIASTATGWFMFVTRPDGPRPRHDRSDYPLLVVTYFGTWSMIAFVYYINRSIAAPQLELFLLPCAIAIVGLIGALLENGISFPIERKTLRQRSGTRLLLAAPLTLAGSWCLASALQSSNTLTAIRWIANPPPRQNFAWFDIRFLASARGIRSLATASETATTHHETIGYYGAFSSWVALIPKLQPLALTTAPGYVSTTDSGSPDCQYLKKHATNEIVVDEVTVRFNGDIICGIYRKTSTTPGSPRRPGYVLYTHIGPLSHRAT